MKDWKDNVFFVLVEPQEQGNIGASARAIKNMGFKNLCLVNPPPALTDEARWLACNALDVLNSAEVYSTVAEAVRDKAMVVGTTRRVGKKRGLILPADKGAVRVCDIATNNRVAVLFGREARGLYNEEVEGCGFMLTIPSSRLQPSLNLAQAVLIVAYELSKTGYDRKPADKKKGAEVREAVLIDQGELNLLYKRMSGVLKLLEYIPRGDLDLEKKIMLNLKYFIGRTGISEWELNMLHGICTQIEKKVGKR